MKTLSAPTTTQKNSQATNPILLMKITLGNATLYLSDRNITVGAQAYIGIVKNWGTFRTGMSLERGPGKPYVDSVTITLENTEAFGSRLADTFSEPGNEPEKAIVNIYQWFDGLADADKVEIFRGIIVNPITWNHQDATISFDVEDISQKYDKPICDVVDANDFPDALPEALGQSIPIIYGQPPDSIGVPVKAGASSVLRSTLYPSMTELELENITDFPTSGTVKIDDEEISYTGKNTTVNRLTGCIRPKTDFGSYNATGGSTTTLIDTVNGGAENDVYKNWFIWVTDTSASKTYVRKISGYNGTTKTWSWLIALPAAVVGGGSPDTYKITKTLNTTHMPGAKVEEVIEHIYVFADHQCGGIQPGGTKIEGLPAINFCRNGNFAWQNVSTIPPDFWEMVAGTWNTHVFWDTAQYLTALHSIRLQGNGSQASMGIGQRLDKLLKPSTMYTFQVYVKNDGANPITVGTLEIDIQSTTAGIDTTGANAIEITTANLPTSWAPYAFEYQTPAGIPADLMLRIRLTGTPNNGGKCYVDSVLIHEYEMETALSLGGHTLTALKFPGKPYYRKYDPQTTFIEVNFDDIDTTNEAKDPRNSFDLTLPDFDKVAAILKGATSQDKLALKQTDDMRDGEERYGEIVRAMLMISYRELPAFTDDYLKPRVKVAKSGAGWYIPSQIMPSPHEQLKSSKTDLVHTHGVSPMEEHSKTFEVKIETLWCDDGASLNWTGHGNTHDADLGTLNQAQTDDLTNYVWDWWTNASVSGQIAEVRACVAYNSGAGFDFFFYYMGKAQDINQDGQNKKRILKNALTEKAIWKSAWLKIANLRIEDFNKSDKGFVKTYLKVHDLAEAEVAGEGSPKTMIYELWAEVKIYEESTINYGQTSLSADLASDPTLLPVYDTSFFAIGDTVFVRDHDGARRWHDGGPITAIDPDKSITVTNPIYKFIDDNDADDATDWPKAGSPVYKVRKQLLNQNVPNGTWFLYVADTSGFKIGDYVYILSPGASAGHVKWFDRPGTIEDIVVNTHIKSGRTVGWDFNVADGAYIFSISGNAPVEKYPQKTTVDAYDLTPVIQNDWGALGTDTVPLYCDVDYTIVSTDDGVEAFIQRVWLEIEYLAFTLETSDKVTALVAGKQISGVTETNPALIIKDILTSLLSFPSGDIDATSFNDAQTKFATDGYVFQFQLADTRLALEVLNDLAYQCRARLFFEAGKAKLTHKADVPGTSVASYTADHILLGSFITERTPLDEVINDYFAWYKKDNLIALGVKGTQKQEPKKKDIYSLEREQDTPSINKVGLRRFEHEFWAVTDATMIDDLAKFYLNQHRQVQNIVSFSTPLLSLEIERGDFIDLTLTDENYATEIIEVFEIEHNSLEETRKFKGKLIKIYMASQDADNYVALTGNIIAYYLAGVLVAKMDSNGLWTLKGVVKEKATLTNGTGTIQYDAVNGLWRHNISSVAYMEVDSNGDMWLKDTMEEKENTFGAGSPNGINLNGSIIEWVMAGLVDSDLSAANFFRMKSTIKEKGL